MKCKNCGKEVQENWAMCPFCGTHIEKKKLCSKCGAELQPNWMMCPFCGEKAVEEKGFAQRTTAGKFGGVSQNVESFDILPNVDDILPSDIDLGIVSEDFSQAQQCQCATRADDYKKKLNLARIACIRKNFEQANSIYEELITQNPEDVNAYIGLIRVVTQNYTNYVGKEIDEAIEVARQIAGKDIAKLDKDYALYAAERPTKAAMQVADAKKRQEEAERKAQEEAKRKKLEEERKRREEKEAKRLEEVRLASLEAMRRTQEEEKAFAAKIALYAKNFDISMDGTLKQYKWNTPSVQIPPCVTKIGCEAFATSLSKLSYVAPCYYAVRELLIPAQITEIGDRAFRNCKTINKLTFEKGSKLQRIGRSAFEECRDLEAVRLPAGVTHIGENAFCNCESICYIELPPSVKSVGNGAFKNIAKRWGGTIVASEDLDLSKCEIPQNVQLRLY